jgi:hypothetical protein
VPDNLTDELDEGAPNPGQYEYAPDGELRWPAPDRDSPQLGTLDGKYLPDAKLNAFLLMEGHSGRSEAEVERVTGQKIKRPRRWHKLFERMGILYPGEGNTRLARLGRMLRDSAQPDGLTRLVAREAIEVLKRYQFDNPVEKSFPEGCSVHPYYAVLRAASFLDWRIHWDEVNREIMRVVRDDQLDDAIANIRKARQDPLYTEFIGNAANDAGLLRARTHFAEKSAPAGKFPEGQLRDQRMTPFLKRVGFGELLLAAPGAGGGGYWTVPQAVRDVVQAAVATQPEAKQFATEQEWIEWFCEGTTSTAAVVIPPSPPSIIIPVPSLILTDLKVALSTYEPDLVFSDALLASVIAALRSGDGRNFIILRGVSGTGKSRLVSALAKAVYGSPHVDSPYLTIVEVRPDWTDGSSVLGHYDPIGRRYVRTPFLDALIAADEARKAAPDSSAPFFVCLDEMNLARVEYYLAECLTAMESGNALSLDTRWDANLPRSLRWPSNVYLFGTINIDESTLRVSDKVLDRAQVIDTSDIDLLPQLARWLDSTVALTPQERDRARSMLANTWNILRNVNAHFGFRAAKAVVRFVDEAKASSGGALTLDDAIDAQLVQKILVKLRGEGERWISPLTELEKLFRELKGRGQAHATVERMRDELERHGSFQYWN